MLVLPYFCKTYTRISTQISSKNLKFGETNGKNVTPFYHTKFLTKISKIKTCFPFFLAELKNGEYHANIDSS